MGRGLGRQAKARGREARENGKILSKEEENVREKVRSYGKGAEEKEGKEEGREGMDTEKEQARKGRYSEKEEEERKRKRSVEFFFFFCT